MKTEETTLLVNAGGASRRMGRPKALLPVPPAGEPLLQYVLDRLLRVPWQQILLVLNQETMAVPLQLPPAVQRLTDAQPGMGPLAGIAAGLACCQGWAVVVAGDMPLLNPQVLAAMLDQCGPEDDVVVPLIQGRYQPLHACYHRRCLPVIASALADQRYRVTDFYDAVRVRTVDEEQLRDWDPDLDSLLNINTPAEWHAVQARLAP